VGLVLLFLVAAVGLLTMLLGLPGSVVILLDALIYGAATGFEKITWVTLVILLALMILAELSDNVLGLAGARRAGASGGSQVLCLIGGIVGAILGGQVSPLLGVVGIGLGPVGAIALMVLGPLAGAFVGAGLATYWWERRGGKSAQETRDVARATLLGRVAGTLLKFAFGVIMVAVIVSAVL
jgi:uncharacterized protein YqgC (DUF456 family)